MFLRQLLVMFLLNGVIFIPLPGDAVPRLPVYEGDPGSGPALARLTSWVLFNGGQAREGVPLLAYGYLSQVAALPQARQRAEDESSAVFSFVVEGTVVSLQQSGPAFMIESQGQLHVFFDPQAKRDFTKPESFRSGEEVATYNLRRQVLFNPADGRLYDRSFASLLSSKSFAFAGVERNLLRLWGPQLTLRAQAHAANSFPSPLPDYTAAIPYTGILFVDGEWTEYTPHPCCDGVDLSCECEGAERAPSADARNSDPFPTVWLRDSSGRGKSWG
jgi:hypothetical protein